MPVSENRIRLDSVFPSLSPEKHYICEVNDKPHINMEHNILIPLLLTLGAGLATGIGSAIAPAAPTSGCCRSRSDCRAA